MTESFGVGEWGMLFESAPDGVIITDVETLRVLDANAKACAMFGYSRDEFRDMNVTDTSAEPRATLDAVSEGVEWLPLRYMLRSDGTTFPAEVAATQFAHEGRLIRVGFVRDVSERIASDGIARASEKKFETAFKTSPDAININRLSDGVYIEVNDGFTNLTGYTAEEVIGRSSLELDIWADPADRIRLVEQVRREGSAMNLEAGFRYKDGVVRIGLMSAAVIDIAGETCLLSVTRNIQHRIEREGLLRESERRLQGMVLDVSHAMGRVVESRDPYTHGHQKRVARLSRLVAEEIGLCDDEVDMTEMAALVHDVGKLAVPSEILNKPGRLSALEMSLIRVHSERGFEILKDIDFGWPIADIVLQHHERIDGSGYPQGLVGEAILMSARILCVADVVEAMASHRPYRPSLGLDAALAEVRDREGGYDPHVVAACMRLHDRGELAFLNE